MLDPLDKEKNVIAARLRRLRILSGLALARERLALAFWRPVCWVLLFAGLWLWRLPALFGAPGNLAALVLFIGGTLWLGARAFRDYRRPRGAEIDRRLEAESGLPHRPLEQISDRLSNPEKEQTRRLWSAGRDDAWSVLSRLRRARTRPVLASADPLALRLLTVLILFSGILAAGGAWRERLTFGLLPFSVQWQDRISDNIVLWVTPPPYTHLAQVTLTGRGRAAEAVDVPEGSTIKISVRNGIGRPHMLLGGLDIPLKKLGEDSWGAETKATAAADIKIRQAMLTRALIPVHYIADTPPVLTLKQEPKIMAKGSLQIGVTAQDDYGVGSLSMSMTLDPTVADAPKGEPVTETRPVMSPAGKAQDLWPIYDLTGHPWAGLRAVIEITAKDQGGNTAVLPPIHVTLPERHFYNPVAQEVAELRKRLLWTPEAAAMNVAYDLERIMSKPGDFDNDIVAFLSMRSASSRLIYDPSEKSVASVAAQLWDTALRIEDGNLTAAARSLRDAQQDMQDLLANPDASSQEIAAASERLKQALAQYMQEIYSKMQKQADAKGMHFDPSQFGKSMDIQDLSNFFDQLQAQALSGNRDAAQQMLAQMQQMMDSLDPSLSMEPPPEMKQLMQTLADIQKLIGDQEKLLDRTKEQAKAAKDSGGSSAPGGLAEFLPFEPGLFENWGEDGAMPPPPQETVPKDQPPAQQEQEQAATGNAELDGLHTAQDELRHRLGAMMLEIGDKLGKIPDGMQKAEAEMRAASDNLAGGRAGAAVENQKKALEYLKQDQQSMNQQMAAMMKNMTLLSFGMKPTDPLGRQMKEGNGPSMMPDSGVKIPSEAERKRVKDILNTLRQRSGDYSRPDYELEYYRRLMRQF